MFTNQMTFLFIMMFQNIFASIINRSLWYQSALCAERSHCFPIATSKKFADKCFNFRVYIYKYMFQWEKLDKCFTIPHINTFYLIINISDQFYMCLPES